MLVPSRLGWTPSSRHPGDERLHSASGRLYVFVCNRFGGVRMRQSGNLVTQLVEISEIE